jgi:ferredoxin
MVTVKIGLHFPPQKVDKPVVYSLIKEYNLMFNILNASVSPGKKGKAIMELTGEQSDIDAGIEFLKAQGLECFLFTDSVIRYEEKCVHCGACTAVCPSGALTLNEDWMLKFDMEKCMLCGHCIKACPTRAILSHEDVLNGG